MFMGFSAKRWNASFYLASCAALVATPAQADTATGILAGLGLTAASGDTKVNTDGTMSEASIRNAMLLRQAATKIDVSKVPTDGKILILDGTSTADFSQYDMVLAQLDQAVSVVDSASSCVRPLDMQIDEESVAKAAVGAIATDTSVSTIKTSLTSNMLFSEIAANHPGQFLFSGDVVKINPQNSKVMTAYESLMSKTNALAAKGCTGDDVKKAVSSAQALITNLNTAPDKTGLTPLIAAMRSEALSRTVTHVLRVNIEYQGGTSVVRSGIQFKLGIPGAVLVANGVVVSWHLSDATSGVITGSGVVICKTSPVNYKDVYKNNKTIDQSACNPI
ncbi:hypothetical protein [Novosphingobium terrae]|uniref:hypothetical protein n=1 Tax=Novosphingobium terrae TaxID=2726189 RepID=UPI00197DA96F|nr:hypothetical protein [Novosphingobium terrae]